MNIFPKIVILNTELPEWIEDIHIMSPEAAYSPWLFKIWLSRTVPFWKLMVNFCHEIGHHVIHLLGMHHEIQVNYDKLWYQTFHKRIINR